PPQGPLLLQLEVSELQAGRCEVVLHSRLPADDGERDGGWMLHASGSGVAAQQQSPAPEPPEWPANVAEAWDPDAYARLAARGLRYGSAFRGVRSALRLSDSVVLARVSLPPALHEEATRYGLHPALLDAALQLSSLWIDPEAVMVPASVKRWSLSLTGCSALTLSLEKRTASADGLRLDLSIWDEQGVWVGELRGLQLRRLTRAALRPSHAHAQRDLYEVSWQPLPYTRSERGGVWALVADAEEDPALVAQLCAQLSALGPHVVACVPDAAPPPGTDKLLRVWPATAPDDVPHATHALASRALGELQAAVRRADGPATWIWLTRGAIASAPEEGVSTLHQAALWGLARSARQEHPELGLRLIDLGQVMPDPTLLMAALVREEEPEL
ncbi:MAG TPA: polyketide synthase dehydratase domain-containing protein, partial [Polyangiales bacterium]